MSFKTSPSLILQQIPYDKIKINFNKSPVRMDLFLSFITVPVVASTDHLGYHTGWTQYRNDEIKLIVGGGCCNGGEWLDNLQYGHRLDNVYNNYVSPLHLFPILTKAGKDFFINYYKEDIEKIIQEQKWKIESLEGQTKVAKENLEKIFNEYESLKND